MATQTTVETICDITGAPAVETVPFAVRGKSYVIDLSSEALADFEAAFAGFIESARVAGKVATVAKGGGNGAAKIDPEQSRAMRDWARRNGYTVSDRGRLSVEVVAAYHARGATG